MPSPPFRQEKPKSNILIFDSGLFFLGGIMYKTVFIEHRSVGYDIQTGKLDALEKTINESHNHGYELVCITPCP